MSFSKSLARVTRAERALQRHERRVDTRLQRFALDWQSTWAPMRIVAAGLASGFLIGRAEPGRVIAYSAGAMRVASLRGKVVAV
ncbi:hypothetical protein [Luteimonas salinilitoris]|uniref:Uncharacterized protein n=1 Tax=Luteimonas salinilitoris TaxID=3237697 RepID=A0ABV4HNS3_9GAMM